MTTALPTEQRPIRIDPELAERVDGLLSKYKGEELEAAQQAVMDVYHSGFAGSFGEILAKYEAAIKEAVGD